MEREGSRGRGWAREGSEGEREITGESESEGEREWYFLFKWLWGPDDQIMEIKTPRPEYPGQWPEYPGVTTCHGSCKVFVGDEGCRFAGCFRRCPDCNENGLIRCPLCCCWPFFSRLQRCNNPKRNGSLLQCLSGFLFLVGDQFQLGELRRIPYRMWNWCFRFYNFFGFLLRTCSVNPNIRYHKNSRDHPFHATIISRIWIDWKFVIHILWLGMLIKADKCNMLSSSFFFSRLLIRSQGNTT